MHPAIIIGTVRSLIVDVAMGQIPRSTERISSFIINIGLYHSGGNVKLHPVISSAGNVPPTAHIAVSTS